MLKKILKLTKKPTNFFLELNEEQPSQEAVSQDKSAVATPPTPQEQPQASSSDAKKTKSQKKRKKAGKKAGEKAQEPVAVSQPAPAKQVYDDVEQLIINAVSAKKAGKVNANSNGAVKNFATDYLISPPAPNRRPGVSLNKFKEMTRTMKVGK